MTTVAILLSTYNGTAFLREQLESLRVQTHPDFFIYWRDDGSTDKTREIVRCFCQEHPEFHLMECTAEKGVNLGYRRSFWTLLRECPKADVYAFCDQDDVWLPHKVADAVSRLLAASTNPKQPVLCTSNFKYASADLSRRTPAPFHAETIGLKDLLFYTPVFGFTLMLNEPLRQFALESVRNRNLPHDRWCAFLAATFGRIVREPRPSALYRRHGATVTSAGDGFLQSVHAWYRREIAGDAFREFPEFMSTFRDTFPKTIPSEADALFKRFLPAEAPWPVRLRRALTPMRFRPTLAGEVALRLSLLRRIRAEKQSSPHHAS